MTKLSIDFDGVVLGTLLNVAWKPKVMSSKKWTTSKILENPLFCYGEALIVDFFQNFRSPLVNSLKCIQDLKKDYELVLLTSRQTHLIKPTLKVLEKYGYSDLFSEKIFNTTYDCAWEYKSDIIKKLGIAIHIDDDYKTCDYISSTLPEVKIFKLGTTPSINRPNVVNITNWDTILSCLGIKKQT